ncbi:MAG: GNAT family N-acetyltransferase [Ruminococcaceae bacterium]|nr:GNAT family N-acetyltransferase [Oscillospiraceae bacterium]
MYDDLIDFLNYVFGFNGTDRNFIESYPKVLKRDKNPCEQNYVITEDGKLKAAVGAYYSTLAVGEDELLCCNIGNVAVHPFSRSKGYMTQCLTESENYNINILNYKKVIKTLLKFKAQTESVCDGELTLLIHGYSGDCKLKISVKNNEVSVDEYDGETMLELSHKDAVRLLLGVHSAHTKCLKPEIRTWFPLPLFIESADQI